MSEAKSVEAVSAPATVASLRDDLSALPLAGEVVLLHVSLSSLGWVCGGPVAVLQAMQAALGPKGTLVMPAFSAGYSDPRHWGNPAVPEAWWPGIRQSMPAFDPGLTPTRGIGRVAETFRGWPGVERSVHPCSSFAAVGPAARELTQGHGLAHPLGDTSPLARLYEHDARILLLGVDHDRNTSLHLAENRGSWAAKQTITQGGPLEVDGERRWLEYEEVDIDTDDFLEVGRAFEATGAWTQASVAAACAKLMKQRALVDFASAWFSRHR
jgi:aminoglycoside 3-N-acetyltransferase